LPTGTAPIWELVPGSPVQHPAAGLGGVPAPLLVEVGNAFGHAPVPQIADTFRIASTVSGTALAAGDDPRESWESFR
jgi:hypothetical protein